MPAKKLPDASGEKKKGLGGLAALLSRLPAEKKRVALEMSAALAGVSLRASRAFVEAVPNAAERLTADDIRGWAEFGRRLAMSDTETAVRFFADEAEPFGSLPEEARALMLRICTSQLVLSSSTALETFALVPQLAEKTADDRLLNQFLALAAEIAGRSAKHSSDFIQRSSAVAEAVARFEDERGEVAGRAVTLAMRFAQRTGGLTADLWGALPGAFSGLSAEEARTLLERAGTILEFGGSVTIHFISSGAAILRSDPKAFDDWCGLVRAVSPYGNAVLIGLIRASPKVVERITAANERSGRGVDLRVVLKLCTKVAAVDGESALAALRSSADALSRASLAQFEEWVAAGLGPVRQDSQKARRSYFALETRQSIDRLEKKRTGLDLESIRGVLRIYVEGLTGREVEIVPLAAVPQASRIGDGKTVHLPASIAELGSDEADFRLYKVLAAHGAGQIEFGTFDQDTPELAAAFVHLTDLYTATPDQLDAFSLAGYINDPASGENARALPGDRAGATSLPANSDHRSVLAVFPEPKLARKIFATMENARIDRRLRHAYRGLRKDLDLMEGFLGRTRPYIFDVPMHQVPFELLFQITLCGGATDDARQFYGQVVSEIESVLETCFRADAGVLPTVADSLIATSRVYNLFQNISPEQSQEAEPDTDEEEVDSEDLSKAAEAVTDERAKREDSKQHQQDLRDLFNAWNLADDDAEPDDLQGSESWTRQEMPEQMLEPDELAFAYDEWDRELNDYRVAWSRVIEKKVKQGDRNFVELARSRYRGVISSIRHQFQLMKPENLTKINREIDGEDYDLNALVDFVIDRKADGRQAENIYTKRLRKQRDVAVSILLDQSSSTARTITRNPLQPYTYPGRRIIEIEKEGLVLMSEALEAVGDVYSISGFTSEGRRNVKFYIVKDFGEKYSEEVEKRIGGITFQNNTRLGAAIRHASAKLLRQEARTKLLIILTDGRPYDHDYGDARYAREDVREALTEAKITGVTPFCITIDRESESELRDLYGDIGYTIIDDVMTLPERMPNIYRRLTT